MKTKILLITLTITGTILFDGCLKKGENDPFISFHSRKARVVGEWEVTRIEGSESSKDPSGSMSTVFWIVTGGTDNWSGTSGFSGSYPRSESLNFRKDGTFSWTVAVDSDVDTYEGIWNFTNGIGEPKNKTQIVLKVERFFGTSGSGTYAGNRYNDTWNITELRNNKIVMNYEYVEQDGTGCTYCPHTLEETYTLEQ